MILTVCVFCIEEHVFLGVQVYLYVHVYLYTYIYTHIFKSSVFCKSCVLNDHLLRPSFCRFIAVVGSWTLWRQSPARDAAFGLCQLAVGCAVRQPQSSPSRHCEYEIGDLASLYSKHRFSTRQASLLPVVFFLLPFFVAHEFSLHEETIHHRAAAALVLGRLEEAVGLYLANELLAEALKSWGIGWTLELVCWQAHYEDDWIISNLAAVSLLGLRLRFSVYFGWNYRNRSRLKCRARLINAFAAVLHLFSDHTPEAVSTGKEGSAKSVKTESCSCTGLATGTSATAITPSIGVVHLP